MLDYAANAQAYWPRDKIKALAAENFGSVEDLDRAVQEFLAESPNTTQFADIDAYWAAVEENLQSGQVRLLFVADIIPTELRRIIEYLNEHMPKVEVLGVEIRQYEGARIRALVPRVVGQTEFARQNKRTSSRSAERMTESGFIESCPETARTFFKNLLREATSRNYIIAWNQSGFGVRITMANGKLGTFFYGIRPGYYKECGS